MEIISKFGIAYIVIRITFNIPSNPYSPNLEQLFNSSIFNLVQDCAIYMRVLSFKY